MAAPLPAPDAAPALTGYYPKISYPGVVAPKSCTYTGSHGISPGTVSLICIEQDTLPAETGNVMFGDGQTQITVPGCRIDNIKMSIGGDGERLWTICLKDRRWKWIGFGAVFGSFNQLDPNSKPIPWTIRSPTELATICLTMLGEQNYVLGLPPGLSRAWGQNLEQFLTIGNRFPPTGVNPPIEWNGDTPAIALQQVAELFGCRVVYDVINDIILVVPVGVGTGLPDGYIRQYGPSLKQIAVPDGIRVFGDRTKFQMRLALEPVGEDWDGSYRLLHDLSYAPFLRGAAQISTVSFTGPDPDEEIGLSATWTLTINTVVFTYESLATDTLFDVSAELLDLVQMSLSALINGVVTATAAADPHDPTLTIRGVVFGFSFVVTTRVGGAAALAGEAAGVGMATAIQQMAVRGERGFDFCSPSGDGAFTEVQPTSHLTYEQALGLAQKSVFKFFRVVNQDVSGNGPINVPSYGPIPRRQQLELTPTLVEQTIPVVPNPNFARNDQILNPNLDLPEGGIEFVDFLESTYDGYSRDLPFRVYGSFTEVEGGVFYLNQFNGNTPGNERVWVDATIDPLWQIVKFNRPMYRYAGGGRVVPSNLTLETGCFLRESESNQFAAFNLSQRLRPGGATSFFESQRHIDVKLGVIGTYKFVPSNSVLTGSGLPQITRVTFSCNTVSDGVFGPIVTALMPAGVVFTVTVDGVFYTYTTLENDTPFIVATAFKNMIPNSATLTVTLASGAPGVIAPPVQLTPNTDPGGTQLRYFAVTALTDLGETTISNEQNCYPGEGVVISWQEVPGATGYNVYVALASLAYDNIIASVGPWVREYGWNAFLSPNFVVTVATPGPTREIPFTATYPAPGTVRVAWEPVSGALYYTIFRRTSLGGLQRIQSIANVITHYDWFTANWTAGSPPIVNTATRNLNSAVLLFTGVQAGVAFTVEADVELEVFPGADIRAIAEVARAATPDQRDYVSNLVSTSILEADPIFRANYYLAGMLLKYQTKIVNTVDYNTIMAISCNGAIAQVTWSVGDGNTVRTTASINCEHSDYVPPYPERRRAEGLAGVLPPNPNVLLPGMNQGGGA